MREKFDQDKKEFNGVTFDDIERYAKIVAYKVANNLKNGFVMDNNDDPLNYGNEQSQLSISTGNNPVDIES